MYKNYAELYQNSDNYTQIHGQKSLRRACGLPAEWTELIRQTNRQEFAADSYDKITDLRH
jgi:hypothetical protein